MESDEDSSCIGYFSKRAKFVPRQNADDLQAAAELVNKIEESSKEVSRNKKTKRKVKKKDQFEPLALDDSDKTTETSLNDSFFEVTLSAAAKRRLKKLREEQELELQSIDAENQRILSAIDMKSNFSTETIIVETDEDFEKIMVLTISFMSKIARLKCYENDKFLNIFPKVAELFDLKVTEFLLCLKAKNITVDDTPKSLQLTHQDVIDCILYKAHEDSEIGDGDGVNTFKVTFQSNDTKNKIDMSVHVVDKMQDIMKRYSEKRNIPLEQLIFDFDGERLCGGETPAELDMEPGSCIDVTVLVSTSNEPKTRGRKKKP